MTAGVRQASEWDALPEGPSWRCRAERRHSQDRTDGAGASPSRFGAEDPGRQPMEDWTHAAALTGSRRLADRQGM